MFTKRPSPHDPKDQTAMFQIVTKVLNETLFRIDYSLFVCKWHSGQMNIFIFYIPAEQAELRRWHNSTFASDQLWHCSCLFDCLQNVIYLLFCKVSLTQNTQTATGNRKQSTFWPKFGKANQTTPKFLLLFWRACCTFYSPSLPPWMVNKMPLEIPTNARFVSYSSSR